MERIGVRSIWRTPGGPRGAARQATELQSCFCSPCPSVSEVEGAGKQVSPRRHPAGPRTTEAATSKTQSFSDGRGWLKPGGVSAAPRAAMTPRRRALRHAVRHLPVLPWAEPSPSSWDSHLAAATPYSPHVPIFCLHHPVCQPAYRTERRNLNVFLVRAQAVLLCTFRNSPSHFSSSFLWVTLVRQPFPFVRRRACAKSVDRKG